MRYRAVSFDLGHTLLFPDYEVYLELLAEAGVPGDRASVVAVESRMRPWFDAIVLEEGVRDGIWIDYYRHFFQQLGVDEEWIESSLLGLRERYREGIGMWTEPAPGATEVLEELKGLGLRLACVSNNDGRLAAMIDSQGWGRFFDVLVDSERVGAAKPDPVIFRHALEALDMAPEEVIHVGDYYSTDVVGARRAGLEGVLYDPQRAYGVLDCTVVHDLMEIPTLLV